VLWRNYHCPEHSKGRLVWHRPANWDLLSRYSIFAAT
jgi:hypothetical protein